MEWNIQLLITLFNFIFENINFFFFFIFKCEVRILQFYIMYIIIHIKNKN